MELNQSNEPGRVRKSLFEPRTDITRPIRQGVEQGAELIQQGREATTNALSSRVEHVSSHQKATLQRLSGGGHPEGVSVPLPGSGAKDKIDLSERARLLSEAKPAKEGEQADEAQSREARVAAMREAYQNGELNTPERVERTAQRMLGGE